MSEQDIQIISYHNKRFAIGYKPFILFTKVVVKCLSNGQKATTTCEHKNRKTKAIDLINRVKHK